MWNSEREGKGGGETAPTRELETLMQMCDIEFPWNIKSNALYLQ